jgi:nitroreductase
MRIFWGIFFTIKFNEMKAKEVTETKQLNGTLATIYKRRAVRKYKNKPVSRNLIEQLLSAGWMAPSAMNRQPWKFYIVTNKELIHAFSKDIAKIAFKDTMKKGVKGVLKVAASLFHFAQSFDFSTFRDPVFYEAPVVIFITSRANNEWAQLDIGMCAQNIMLAAKSLGLDTCPVGFGKFVEHTGHYSLLNIPEAETVQLSIIVGYGAEAPDINQRKTDNIIFID